MKFDNSLIFLKMGSIYFFSHMISAHDFGSTYIILEHLYYSVTSYLTIQGSTSDTGETLCHLLIISKRRNLVK